ncbi:NB-ARC domain-containing protein, partial [Streptomyces alkaliterrae]
SSSPTRPAVRLPRGPAGFVARGVELARLRERLTEAATAPVVCLLDGPGGVGKSALAVRAARDVADRFPDGVLHVDLHGSDPCRPPLRTSDVLQTLLTALGVDERRIPRDTDQALALYRECLADRRVLLVLDNALRADQVAPLLPDAAGCAALVTSRAVLTGLGEARHLHLDTLSAPDAIALVGAVSGRPAEAGEQPAWEELVNLCGRLPLALRIVATRMASRPRWSVADWVAVLRDERGRLDELVTADVDARASLMVGIDQLAGSGDRGDREAARRFWTLGVCAVTHHTAPTFAALTGLDAPAARDVLERLTDAQIATSPTPGRYALHDLVRSAALRDADRLPAAERHRALARLSSWYLGTLYRSTAPLPVGDFLRRRFQDGAARHPEGRLFERRDEALEWVDLELPEVLALAEQLAQPEFDGSGPPLDTFALEATRALESYFAIRFCWRHQEQLAATQLAAAERRSDAFAQAVALASLGRVAGQRGDGASALRQLDRAITLFDRLGAQDELATSYNNQVPCLAMAGRLEEAVAVGRRALGHADRHGLPEVRCSSLNNLGRVHLMRGERDEALRLLTESYRLAPVNHHLVGTASVLAEFHLSSAEFEQAAHWARRGLEHAAEQPFDPPQIAELYTALGAALAGLGRGEQAVSAEQRARSMLADFNSREAADACSRRR